MAAGRWKVTLGLRLNSIGASESYITPLGEDTVMTAKVFTLLMRARRDLLHSSVKIIGLRIAQIADELDRPIKRRSQFFRPAGTTYPFIKPDDAGNGGTSMQIYNQGFQQDDSYKPDLAQTSLVYRIGYSGGRWVNRYLFGFPDEALFGEAPTVRLNAVNTLSQNWSAFRTALLSGGWSVYVRNVVSPFDIRPIQRWASSGGAPAFVGVVVAVVTADLYPVGSYVQISGTRRRGTDKMSYNGRYVVQSITPSATGSPGTVFLAATEAGDASSVKLPGTIQKIGKGFTPITGAETVMGGSHKRGKPLDTPRGNKQKRVLLDP